MKKIYMILFAFTALIVLTSFNYVSSSKAQNSSSKNKVYSTTNKKMKKNKKTSSAKKNVKKQQDTEITETKIEITDEYRQLLNDEETTSLEVVDQHQAMTQKVAVTNQKPNENNPNKVHYFIRSKENPNFYETK